MIVLNRSTHVPLRRRGETWVLLYLNRCSNTDDISSPYTSTPYPNAVVVAGLCYREEKGITKEGAIDRTKSN